MPSSTGTELLESRPCAARASVPLYILHVIHLEPLWLHSALLCVLQKWKTLLLKDEKSSLHLLAGTPAPSLPLRRTCRRLPCLKERKFLLLWKKNNSAQGQDTQHSRGECSGSQRSDSHSLRPPGDSQLGSLQNLYPKGWGHLG